MANLFCTTGDGAKGINTAIGCLPYLEINPFIITLLQWALGIAGGTALTLIIFASFQIAVSRGNPETFNAGKELFASALAGIIFLIFSVYLLRLIGYDILKLPGF